MSSVLLGDGGSNEDAHHCQLMLILKVSVEVIFPLGGEVAIESQSHEEPSIGIKGVLSLGTIEQDPRGVNLYRKLV